jgi:hypothetical protein
MGHLRSHRTWHVIKGVSKKSKCFIKVVLIKMKTLEEKIMELPPIYQQEVEDFVDFLAEKKIKILKKTPTFSWAGALKDMRDEYTSVELQHKIADWWAGEE